MKSSLVRGRVLVVTVIVLAGLAAGCSNPLTDGGRGASGSLSVSLSDEVSPRTLLPDLDMEVASYRVSGSGPDDESFSVSSDGGTVTVEELAFGEWNVSVAALNASEQVIGTGMATVTVTTGETTSVTIVVVPVVGTGTLELSVDWNHGDVQIPAIAATLTESDGTSLPLDFAIDGTSADFTSSQISTGYHTLALQLLDNGIVVAGAVEVIRIADDATTSGHYMFDQVNAPGGTIDVRVTPEMGDPLTVSIAGSRDPLATGESMVLEASIAESVAVTYVWYVNGESVATGGSYRFAADDYGPGFYRIDVTAYSADGARAGSATAETQVVDAIASPSQIALRQKVTLPTSNKTSLGTPWVSAIHADGESIMAGGYHGGLSISADGGATWTSYVKENGLWDTIRGVAVVGNRIVAGSYGNGVYVSDDGGLSWQGVYTPGGLANHVIDLAEGDGILATVGLSTGGIHVSTDGGTTWAQRYPSQVLELSIDSGIIYAAGPAGITLSSNAGANWSSLSAPADAGSLSSIYVRDGVIHVGDYSGELHVRSGGTWTSYGSADGISLRNVRAILDTSTAIYAGGEGGLAVSRDDGATWSMYSRAEGLGSDVVYELAIDPSNGRVYAGTEGGLSYSDDDGLTWQTVAPHDGLGGVNVRSLNLNGQAISTTTWNGTTSLSGDLGETWRVFTANDGLPSRNTVAALQVNGSLISGTGEGVFVSTDDGVTWQRTWTADVRRLTQAAGTIYAAGYGGLAISADGGQSWTTQTTADGLLSDSSTALFATADAIYLGHQQGGMSIYRDGTWETITDGLPESQITDLFVDGASIYAGYSGGLAISRDAGSSWSLLSGLPQYLRSVYAVGDFIAIGTTNDGLYFSFDGGATWEEYFSDRTYATINDIVGAGTTVYVAVSMEGIWQFELQ